MTPLLQLDGLHAQAGGFPLLSGVDLGVQAGEQVALLGPSGAGKTSLLRVLGGSLLPTHGHARILGCDVESATSADLRNTRAHIGFVHQDLALIPTLRVLQNVLAGRLGRGGTLAAMRALLWPSKAQRLDVLALLDRLGIGDKLYERLESLSGGEQQRVALARALYQEPKVLLADEPIAAVDPARARSVLELLTAVARERNLALVVSLHQADLAREFFPRLVGLRAGRVVFDRPAGAISDAEWAELYDLEATP
ncbi:MAG: ATP-binding cassette domain-containing protein [Planctomycetota bacterium]